MKPSEIYLYCVLTLWTLWFLYFFGFPGWASRTYERTHNSVQLWSIHLSEVFGRISQTYRHILETLHAWLQDALVALLSGPPHDGRRIAGEFPDDVTLFGLVDEEGVDDLTPAGEVGAC